MMKNNVIIEDDFFDDPNIIRKNGILYLKSIHDNILNDTGDYPGIKSYCLSENKVEIFTYIKTKVEELTCLTLNQFSASFHLTNKYHEFGLCHRDSVTSEDKMISGVIYLNPNLDISLINSSGTIFCQEISPAKCGQIFKLASTTQDLNIIKKFAEFKSFYNTKHYKPIKAIQNLYNRCVIFDSNIPHAPGTYFGESWEDSRLLITFSGEHN
jgi:hypothetical protein